MIDQQLSALDALGQLENYRYGMDQLATRLSQVPLWQPSHILRKQVHEAQQMIAGLQTRMERCLVVTLIGPSGAGKSTLLNALAGIDNLSPTGGSRPTTRNLVVLAKDAETVHQLFGETADERIKVHTDATSEMLAHMVLVDTPDTDSTQNDAHWPLIEQAVSRSDILICVFDAQNPKRRDHIDFMAPLVQRFHGASLLAVVNQCDRQDKTELTDTIGPEFRDYLNHAWDTQPEAMLFVSARSHLRHPNWSPQAQPRHDLDQFPQLRERIMTIFAKPGFAPDRRLANARQIHDFIQDQLRSAAAADSAALKAAQAKIVEAEQQAMHSAVERLRTQDQQMVLGIQARLYQALAQQWMGPVGWLVAVWSRLVLFGTGLAALLRFGNPLSQLWGALSAWRRYKDSRAALAALDDETRMGNAMQAFQQTLWILWPEIAEHLVTARFDPQVRRLNTDDTPEAGRLAQGLWVDTLNATIDQTAKRLSHFLLQLLFNLPSLALLGYVAWLTAARFVAGTYLTTDFFLHALLAIAVVLLLSFFLFQIIVRLASGHDRIQQKVFQTVKQHIGDHPLIATGDVAEQVVKVLSFGG